MIKLVAIEQTSGKEYILDTYGTENINLTLQVDDVRDISSKNASYSKDFNLPATKNNNKFFEHYNNLDRITVDFNVYKNVKALLYEEDVLIFEGFIRLLNVLDKDTEITYNVVLFNDVTNLIDTLGDSTLCNLDYTDIAHVPSSANIENSWTGVTVLSAGGTTDNVFYPLVDDGQMIDEDNAPEDTQFAFASGFYTGSTNYLLNIKLKYIIDKIFAFAGFTYNSDFFNSVDFKNIFFDTGIGTTINDITGNIINSTAIAATYINDADSSTSTRNTDDDNTGFTMSPIDLNNPFLSPKWSNETGDINDNWFFADFDSPVYQNSETETQIKFNITLPFKTSNGMQDITLKASKYNSSAVLLDEYFYEVSSPLNPSVGGTFPTVFFQRTFEGQLDLNAGDIVIFNFFAVYPNIFIVESADFTTFNLTIEETEVTPTQNLICESIGDIKLADIVTDVFQNFNLTLENKGNKIIKIEPYDTFAVDTVTDWTDKVDINEMVIEPLEMPKRIEFRHVAEDNDYYKNLYKQSNGIGFGDHRITLDIDNDTEVVIENKVFASPYVARVSETQLVLQTITESDGTEYKGFDNAPRLVYKRDFSSSSALLEFGFTPLDHADDIGFMIPVTSWEDVSENTVNATFFSNNISNASSGNSLLYGLINPNAVFGLGTQTTNTLFDKYWFNYIKDRYNETNGLILKVNAKLSETDIANFSFRGKIQIGYQHYRVNKIEFNTDQSKLAKLELLRV